MYYVELRNIFWASHDLLLFTPLGENAHRDISKVHREASTPFVILSDSLILDKELSCTNSILEIYDIVIRLIMAIWNKFHFVQNTAPGRIRRSMKLAWTGGRQNNDVPFQAAFP